MKERLVTCNEEDTDGRARGDKRRGASSTCRLNRDKIV